jgi:hypothetical protein
MIKEPRSGEQMMPDQKPVEREGRRGFIVVRMALFFLVMAILVLYINSMASRLSFRA